MKFFEKTRGSISVFLILILLPLYSGIYLAIDSVRYEAARAKVYGALNLTGNGATNDYDTTLKELYGLFAMSKSQEDYEKELAVLFSDMLDTKENMISTETESFTVTLKGDSVLARPEILETYVVDYMKYRAPYAFASGVGQRLGVFSDLDTVSKVQEKSESYYDSLSGLDQLLEKWGEKLKEADSAEELDVKTEQKNIAVLQKGLSDLKKEVKGVSKEATNWEKALSGMSSGDLKNQLTSTYSSVTGIFTSENLNAFQKQLEADQKQLTEYESAEDKTTVPTLHYKENGLYSYIRSSAGSAVSSEEKETAGSVKDGLKQLANTKSSSFLSKVSPISVNSACGSTIATEIEKLGSTGSTSLKEAGNNQTAQRSLVKQFFSALKGTTESLAEEAFLEEFMTEQFSCYTTGDEENALSGAALKDSPLFHGEVEYILFGKDDLKTNVVLATDLLFALRFLFNSIYACSNAKMRSEALTVAAALAGWTGVGVTVAQNMILLLWATAESVLDVATLCKGESVPLYKNASTWTLGLGGIASTLKQGATSYVSNTIDDIYQKIEGITEDKIDELADAATGYIVQSAEGAAESLTNQVVTPIEQKITSLIGNKTASVSGYSRAQIREMILSSVNQIGGSSKGAELAKTLFVQNYLDCITDQIYANYEYLFAEDDTLSRVATEKIEDALSDLYEDLFRQLEDQLEGYADTAKNKVNSALSSGAEKAKAAAVEAIDDYSQELASFLGSEKAGTSSVTASSGLAMSYKDYMKVFAFVLLLSKGSKNQMVTRTAKLMQAKGKKQSADFNLTACYTCIELTGSAKVAAHRVEEKEEYGY